MKHWWQWVALGAAALFFIITALVIIFRKPPPEDKRGRHLELTKRTLGWKDRKDWPTIGDRLFTFLIPALILFVLLWWIVMKK